MRSQLPSPNQSQEFLMALLEAMKQLKDDSEEQQRNIYILSGVFGGVNLCLIIAVIILIYAIIQVKKQLDDAAVEKQVEKEMDALKYAAYTGEEVHRKMVAASTLAAPLNQGGKGPDSEYAFNAPFVDDRVVPNQSRPDSSASRLNRY